MLGERSQARIVETYVGARGVQLLRQRRHRGLRRRERGARSLQGAAGERRRVPRRQHARPRRAQRQLLVALVLARRQAGAQRRPRDARRRRRRGDAERAVSRRRRPPGRQSHDHRSRPPHCPSHEIYKGILGGRARAVFNGKIIVRQDAQKTDAKQTNRALLLSDDALINTKPQLEIFADDVKCTHGAAIGQLDEDAIFYLRARGLTFFEARDMLIHAFAGEILERVKIEPLKRRARVRALRAARARSRGGGRGMSDRVASPQRRRCVAGFDVARIREDFPILRRAGPRQAAGLSRQRRDDAEAAGGARRADELLRHQQRQRASRRAPAQRDRDRAHEAAREKVRGVLQRRLDARDRLHAQLDRGHQPRGARASAAGASRPATRC